MSTPYHEAFEAGVPFARFVEEARANRALWEAYARRAALTEEAMAELDRLVGCFRLLVLADDWCGDAVNTLPVIARLAEASPHLELRVVPRDAFPEVRDRHLTRGSRSIPIVIPLDLEGRPLGHWGPRPTPLQARFERELWPLPKAERYLEIRRWYARDRGATTAKEILALLRGAAATSVDAGEPCGDRKAA